MQTTETMTLEFEDTPTAVSTTPSQNQTEVSYTIEKLDEESERWAVRIETGTFREFLFTIEHMRLYTEDEDGKELVTGDNMDELVDKDVHMDFEYDIKYVPPTYVDNSEPVTVNTQKFENNQELFEQIARNILMDIVINYPELYSTEKE